MSGTPRTDAVWADKTKNILLHARTLERELAAVTAERDAIKADMDWLEQKRLPLIPCFGISPPMGSGLPFPFEGYVTRHDDDEPKPLRAAIAAARKEHPMPSDAPQPLTPPGWQDEQDGEG